MSASGWVLCTLLGSIHMPPVVTSMHIKVTDVYAATAPATERPVQSNSRHSKITIMSTAATVTERVYMACHGPTATAASAVCTRESLLLVCQVGYTAGMCSGYCKTARSFRCKVRTHFILERFHGYGGELTRKLRLGIWDTVPQ